MEGKGQVGVETLTWKEFHLLHEIVLFGYLLYLFDINTDTHGRTRLF
jgi:hypothetical protein